MRARPSCNSLSLIGMTWSSFVLSLAMASSSWFRVCSLEKIAQPPHCFLVRGSQRHLLSSVLEISRVRARSPLDEADRDRKRRALAAVREPGHADRLAEAHRGVEHRLRRVGRAHEPRAAAADDDARVQQAVESRLADLLAS